MEVDVQVERGAETLDECHRPGLGAGGDGESGVLDEVSRDRTVDDAQAGLLPEAVRIDIGMKSIAMSISLAL